MKKSLKKIFILILIVMMLLPTSRNFASSIGTFFDDWLVVDEENSTESEVVFKVKETGYYSIDFLTYPEWSPLRNGSGSYVYPQAQRGSTVKSVYLSADDTYTIRRDVYNQVRYIEVTMSGNGYFDQVPNQETLFEQVEKMLAWFVRTCANGLITIINWAVGGDGGVTIDKIIFNHYKPTQLSFFDVYGSTNPEKGYELVTAISDSIMTWFKLFRQIAIAGYSAIILFIGIRITFKSTAEGKAEAKRLLMDWVVGLGLLFLFPYAIEASININNYLVAKIESGKSEVATPSSGNKEYTSLSPNSTKEEIKDFTDNFDSNPFSDDDNDYMAIMARKAEHTERLAHAVVYMIMAWQLLTLLRIYYKRLFMVGFLMVLLPVTALTYAVDKVKDGSSQAFDTWGKELMVNIFLQSFHAIVYVFAMNVTFQAQDNWIITIVGVSFLFKGEDVIKSLFGMKGETVQSLTTTAMKAMATYQVVKKGLGAVKDNFIGKDSHLGRAWVARRNAREYAMMASNFDMISSTGPALPSASSLPHAPSIEDDESRKLGDSIQIINHMNLATPKELALAINNVQNYWRTGGKYMAMLNDLNLTKEQLDGLQAIKENALRGIKNGIDAQTITQDIKIELQTLLPGMDTSIVEQALYQQMTSPLVGSNHLPRNISSYSIQRELADAKRRQAEIEGSLNFATSDGGTDADIEEEAKALAFNIYHRDVGEDEGLSMARKVVMLKNRDKGKNSAKEIMDAVDEVNQHKDDSDEYRKMVQAAGVDIDELRHVVADKIMKDGYGANYRETVSVADKVFMSDTYHKAVDAVEHYEKSASVKKEDLDEISIHTLLRNENTLELSDDGLIKRVRASRLTENRNDADLLRDFANKVKERGTDRVATYNGMTKEDILEMQRIEESKSREELFRAGVTTASAAVTAPIGAAVGIAVMDGDSSIITEAATGASAAMGIGDWVAETAVGRTPETKQRSGKNVKKITLRNPYTGKDQEVEIISTGILTEKIYSYDDPALPSDVSARIREQFLAEKIKEQRAEEIARMKKLKEEEAKKRK